MIKDNFGDLKKFYFAIVIPSKGRPDKVGNSHALFPFQSCIYVHESEAEEYEKNNPEALIVTHRQTRGYGSVINSIMRNGKKDGLEYVLIIDDDFKSMYCLVGNRRRKMDLGKRYETVCNFAQVMEDGNLFTMLFSTSSNIIKYVQSKPITVGFNLAQGAYMINVQKINIFFEEGYHNYEGCDFFMQNLLKNRFALTDQRFLINGPANDALTSGGCNSFRTSENEKKSREWLKNKWKSHIRFAKNASGNIKPRSTVQRSFS